MQRLLLVPLGEALQTRSSDRNIHAFFTLDCRRVRSTLSQTNRSHVLRRRRACGELLKKPASPKLISIAVCVHILFETLRIERRQIPIGMCRSNGGRMVRCSSLI